MLLHSQGYIKGGYRLIIYGINQFRPADTFAEIEKFNYSADNKTLLINVWMYGNLSILKIISPHGFKVYNDSFEIECAEEVWLDDLPINGREIPCVAFN
ncbi:hypothetical protein NIES2101_42765 [Calothrix sp. HK-06]|nr:hypothetical protein NIES2101_42765 [Calothrix sp. HK-06]